MKLGSIDVVPTVSRREQLFMLLWGKPGCGKTVLAATAPGKKLWLQFDPAGTASLKRSDDIFVADFSSYKSAQLAAFKQGGVIEQDLLKLMKEHSFDTVVVDSLTGFGQMALHYGISSGKANSGKFVASIEAPGQTGYGIRSAMILDFVAMVMRVCSDNNAHCILTCHDREVLDDDGSVKEITLNLGGQGGTIIPSKISEIWHLEDTGKERIIYVRAHGLKKPMRTRMFLPNGDITKFLLRYDQDKDTGDGLKEWYAQWERAGFNKVPLPK